ncbi:MULTISPECIES: acetyl/propionyl/methylcrotonyl-CoA carboxylase subunit alpha [unclassified Corallococcus]|uniref:acetyl/propionyl/methylcrotonyl-CoA carboxylase subunit alpha n=1 Tax=unclassified Corallococcus TaxID=2685029 RepID=UPI001A8FBD4B|nr:MULTISPECIES: acetyl-CoA carboxylase biotin carboxylase subunit [unclassified Corallococcus]MBN9686216.1 acetyl-CoA carboxylase biotin carboxylase subunit [Corallococcus sp. NCSPR001]WAS82352.1 acetyl-CoA carboxylase biotin carboxylase subunit [Corallococcus sp. NCRR]
MKRIHKVLVANRGEIAVRVLRTCRRLGLRTVAVFSDADRDAPHVRLADEAMHLGPPPARESYLSIEKVLAAAKASGADAIHPGYGFLSENEDFARACAEAGFVFVGPPAEAIELMGNKRQAKLRMQAADVPCIPGYEAARPGESLEDEALVREGQRVGFPIMVKAAAGGGGRGMRLVREPGALLDAIRSARSEATNAFGSGELILERAIEGARHVEVQVFADEHGNAVHLGERDCSVQRRHQKVIEESPSPAVTPELRERMGAVAVQAIRAIGYRGAGTIEFLLAPNGDFFFMEMNTRLQVEHPVTELITGLDLVEWQLRVADGEPLPLTQPEITWRGHAIEARLCAEDPAKGFLPQTGRLLAWEPPAGEGVRVDHGVREGQDITPFYDSMQAKIIAYGPDRETARERLAAALRELTVFGVTTNSAFIQHVLGHEAFRSGRYDTGFVGAHTPPETLQTLGKASPEDQAILAALLFHDDAQALARKGGFDATLTGWSSSYALPVPVSLHDGASEFRASVRPVAPEAYEVGVGDTRVSLSLRALSAERAEVEVAGRRRAVRYRRAGGTLWCTLDGITRQLRDVSFRPPSERERASDGRLRAPMDGRIIRVSAEVGATVKKGDVLVVLEAMKMESSLIAPTDGVVTAVNVTVGAQVPARHVVAVVSPAAKEAA